MDKRTKKRLDKILSSIKLPKGVKPQSGKAKEVDLSVLNYPLPGEDETDFQIRQLLYESIGNDIREKFFRRPL